MPSLLRGDAVVADDDWLRIEAGTAVEALPAGNLLVPLSLWLQHREGLAERPGPLGVWLASEDDPEALSDSLDTLALIAVEFPAFTDGRGYSTARILRERLGYRGELRAIGDVLRDQLFLMRRCGFDSFQIRADRDAAAALASFGDFHHGYQHATVDPDEPLLERGRGRNPA